MGLDLSAIFQIAGVGVLVAVIHTVLRQSGKEEFAHWATLTGFVVILFMVIHYIGQLFNEIMDVFRLH
ncbi:stage III sporulation protein AC [Kyrpidia spormannii]|uniref:Stage III sporulation protein AC n=1 Tax=Kyrpidia spormannii TaxID=2055160 RepID=A0A2K8N5M7_9BACL|nr:MULTISPECIES: stage III sporulation protein AC [Kyrpidia]ATY84395.1 stage III sporulation protein AC [Kyrpidia spormannii]MBE3551615.1 stage III sporulation protein AC [Kyrpidia tusciae]MCL6576024.1 stage III sporulation protein AC [Kyrpidia sp.]HHY67285.1 stage III sporulation protein AC [Alicyclobacillus sp.]